MSVLLKIGAATQAVELDAAIVDLDGTMVDTIGDFAEAISRMLADLGLPSLPAQAIEHMVGKGTEHLLRSVLAHVLQQAGQSQDALAEAVQQRFAQALQRYEFHYLSINGQYSRVYRGAGRTAGSEAGWLASGLCDQQAPVFHAPAAGGQGAGWPV